MLFIFNYFENSTVDAKWLYERHTSSTLWQSEQNSVVLLKIVLLRLLSHSLVSASFPRRGVPHNLLGQTEAEQKIGGQRKQLRGLARNLAPVGGLVLHRQREHPEKTAPPADRYICYQGNRWHWFCVFHQKSNVASFSAKWYYN